MHILKKYLPKRFKALSALLICVGLFVTLQTYPSNATDNLSFGNLASLDYQVGGIVVTQPKYEGGKEYRVYGFPIILPDGIAQSDVITFRGSDDFRLRVLEYQGFELGPLAGWRFDRNESDGKLLQGLGDVDGGLVMGLYAGYRFGGFFPFISYHHQVTGDETGGVMRFGSEFKVPIASNFSYTLLAGASYAGSDYMNSYFTVTPEQSASTGFRLLPYSAGPSIKDFYLGLMSDVPLTKDWTLKIGGNYTRLVGDAANSPVVETPNQFYGGLGLTYRFNFQR